MPKLKKAQAQSLRLLLALIVVLLGGIGSIFWGLGIALSNIQLLWIGRILVASIPFVVAILERFLR
ncbi:MAG: hypothetical protein QT01_C0009G0032 [archaeon GW2011_AR6]|nr:MAG: hypothetical protein QT01_C0009G0032 [archaeon GW2011_AR6]